ncbi:MAG: hypothetical protein J6W37_02525, partial [Bacteroidales bacterium]|nr:hypothetical protein [Bacteroidales bacterium]
FGDLFQLLDRKDGFSEYPIKADNDLAQYLEKCAQRSRLRKNGVDQCIDYCITMDTCNVIPYYKDGVIKNLID